MKVTNTLQRSFTLLKNDSGLIVLFILPAVFSLLSQRIITNYFDNLWRHIDLFSPEPPSMRPILLFLICYVVGFLLGLWASAGAVLKVTELDKGSKLGLKEALSKGLRKVPRLVPPAIIISVVSVITIASLAIVVTNFPLLVLDTGSSVIVLRVALGFLFVIGLYLMVRLRLYAPACVLEDNFGLKTSWKLVKGSWWKLFAILLIFWAMSLFFSLAWIIGPFLSGLIVGPFSVTAMTLIYLQLKQAKSSGEEHKESL